MQEKLNSVPLSNLIIKVGLFQILVLILKSDERITDYYMTSIYNTAKNDGICVSFS